MKFLIDAQLPLRFGRWLAKRGHDALHTLEMPLGNRTPDTEIVALAAREGRIVVTKDSDFVQSFLLTGHPSLLFVSTGNFGNPELEFLFQQNLPAIESAFESHKFVEINQIALIIHE